MLQEVARLVSKIFPIILESLTKLFFLADTAIRAIGTRAHFLRTLTFYSSMCIVVSIVA